MHAEFGEFGMDDDDHAHVDDDDEWDNTPYSAQAHSRYLLVVLE